MFSRRQGKGIVVTIEFPEDVAKCEKTLKNGMNSLVAFKAKWCGACHQFNDNVWNDLTKTKNRNMNLISVDSEIAPKIIRIMNMKPPEYYPTLTVAGKDGKAASFQDEKGNSTNAMPRQGSLPEDKVVLTQLITSKQPNFNNNPVNRSTKSNNRSTNSNVNEPVTLNLKNEVSTPRAEKNPNTSAKINSLARSPFTETIIPSISETSSRQTMSARTVRVEPIKSISEDLVGTQTPGAPTATSGVIATMKGGRLLRAIKEKTAALKAMLKQAYRGITRKRSRK